jgi:paraquat-inducible protein B
MKKASPTVIGGFVVGAVALTVGGLMLFGSGPLFRKAHTFVAYFDQSVAGLRTGAPVKFRGVEVGQVKGVYLDLGERENSGDVSIPVVFELYDDLIRERGADVPLDDLEWVENAIASGFRAQLLTESIVTGRLYVALDFQPGTPAVFRSREGAPYPEVPTLPTAFEQIQQQVTQLVSELQTLPLDSIGESISSMFRGLDRLANSPELEEAILSLQTTLDNTGRVMARLEAVLDDVEKNIGPMAANVDSVRRESAAALREARSTLESVRLLIEPGAPLAYELEEALREFTEAARSIQALVDYLERNPGSLVRGREVKEEKQ